MKIRMNLKIRGSKSQLNKKNSLLKQKDGNRSLKKSLKFNTQKNKKITLNIRNKININVNNKNIYNINNRNIINKKLNFGHAPDFLPREQIALRSLFVIEDYLQSTKTKYYTLSEKSKFFEDLNIRSLDHVELVYMLEDHFNVELADEVAVDFKTPGDFIDYLERTAFVREDINFYEHLLDMGYEPGKSLVHNHDLLGTDSRNPRFASDIRQVRAENKSKWDKGVEEFKQGYSKLWNKHKDVLPNIDVISRKVFSKELKDATIGKEFQKPPTQRYGQEEIMTNDTNKVTKPLDYKDKI